jgi:hypothetical protein
LGGYIRSYYSSGHKKISKGSRFIGNTFMDNNQGISFKIYCKENCVYLNDFVNNNEFNAEGIGNDF